MSLLCCVNIEDEDSYFEVHSSLANQTSDLCNRKRRYENIRNALPTLTREVTGNVAF